MNEIIEKAKTVTTYKADFKETISSKGKTMTSQGTLAVKSPDKMHKTAKFNVKEGATKEEYVIGDVVWTYIPSLKAAQKIDMAKVKKAMQKQVATGAGDMVNPFAGLPKNKIKFIEAKTVEGKSVYVFDSVISTAAQSQSQGAPQLTPQKVILWVDPATGMRQKHFVYAKDGSIMIEATYSNYRLNVQIAESEFQFNPPPGVQLKDMTDATISNMKKQQ